MIGDNVLKTEKIQKNKKNSQNFKKFKKNKKNIFVNFQKISNSFFAKKCGT